MSDGAANRVRAALTAGNAPARRDIEHALRESLGLSARQAKRFAAEGARSLGAVDSDEPDLAERIQALERALRV